ncbi:MAG TPA: hypothetical protein VJR27_02645 [Candidatus Saccharimonadales bacterium]|nr:hypothetical protein [Candidatus Saccharimonadales bacterium]
MIKLHVTPERLRNARPESVASLGQLMAGQIVVTFNTYNDTEGRVNFHLCQLAVVAGSAYRILDGQVVDRGMDLGKCLRVEPLPTYTRDLAVYEDPTWLRVQAKGIEGVDENGPPAGLSRGLMVVREEPYQVEPNLEVGPHLYVNGANDYHTIYKSQFMAVALDSDPRLSGQL